MNKTTTALTDAIHEIMERDATSWQLTGEGIGAYTAIDILISLLQKERENIRDAFIDGKTNANTANRLGCHEDTGNTYFTETFTQYKTETNG